MLGVLLEVLCMNINTITKTRNLLQIVKEAGNRMEGSACACNQCCADCCHTLYERESKVSAVIGGCPPCTELIGRNKSGLLGQQPLT